ncbi:hypothetical protein ACFX58_13965 [Sphingomonas sp. NCPPB 2930]
MFQRIEYEQLNSRQKENFNFQKVAAHLADYGFNCLRLSDDWQGADFIACHIDGETVLKVQLKGRLTIDRKYGGKGIHVAFCEEGTWYLYPHDETRDLLLALGLMTGSRSWDENGGYSWPYLTPQVKAVMTTYVV